MAFSLNKVMLLGNLGKDAEHRFTTNNKSVSSFSIATTQSYKGKDDNWVEETTWHNVVSWSLSDFMKEKLVKGAKFFVEGRIKTRSYEAKDGTKRYVTEVVSEKLIPLDGRSSDGGTSSTTSSNFDSAPASGSSTPEDDLPF